METPICDFVRGYAEKNALRLHMPGHKGTGPLGVEALDITEITGADSLYEAEGIIKKSEENASFLFGCPTCYSAEGSSLGIRAMLYLGLLYAKEEGKRPVVLAGRNAHKTFLSAACLLDLTVLWLEMGESSYLSCPVDAKGVERAILSGTEKPAMLYLTSPDYLGNTIDLREIAEVCHRYGVLLLVDNAHGAYLSFLEPSQHPIALGADLCCDSAHKTLPVLTGGGYLHLSEELKARFGARVKQALALFGSTSPSYLILQSLDSANRYLASGYWETLEAFVRKLDSLKKVLQEKGYTLIGDEPLKLTICAKSYGYYGTELGKRLEEKAIVPEFSDPDFLVLMLTPELGEDALERLKEALLSIPKRMAILEKAPTFQKAAQILSPREAVFSQSETLPIERCAGKILAAASVGCPPAVPIVMCGERIETEHLAIFRYYGITSCTVVKE